MFMIMANIINIAGKLKETGGKKMPPRRTESQARLLPHERGKINDKKLVKCNLLLLHTIYVYQIFLFHLSKSKAALFE